MLGEEAVIFKNIPSVLLLTSLHSAYESEEELRKSIRLVDGLALDLRNKTSVDGDMLNQYIRLILSVEDKLMLVITNKAIVDSVSETLVKKSLAEKALLCFNDIAMLSQIKKRYPSLKMCVTISHPFPNFGQVRKAGADFVLMPYSLTKGRTVREAHARGVGIVAFTVNDASTFIKLQSAGVDAVITEKPTLKKEAEKLNI